jgi:hypothetical protein
MPGEYTTNEAPLGIYARYFLSYAPTAIRARAEDTASELLQWVARIRFNDNDFLGTLLALLALRHRDRGGRTFASDVFMRFAAAQGWTPPWGRLTAIPATTSSLRTTGF